MKKIERIAIMGAGSMGTLLGARLAARGLNVHMADISRALVDAINQHGLTVHGTVELQVPATASTPENMEGQFDLIVVLLKQTGNVAAIPQIREHLAPEGIVLTLQNGIPEPGFVRAFGPDRVMGCAVTWGATLQKPGVTLATTGLENWHNSLGRIDGKITDQVLAVRDILEYMAPTQVTENLIGIRWSKLLVNSALSGMSAALGCTFGEAAENPEALRCAQYIARECILVSQACGVRMEPLAEGEDFARMMLFRDETDRGSTEWIFRKLFLATARGKASMLMDIERGVPTEIDFLNGYVCREAETVGIEVPYCSTVVKIVKSVEQGKMTASVSNLPLFPKA